MRIEAMLCSTSRANVALTTRRFRPSSTPCLPRIPFNLLCKTSYQKENLHQWLLQSLVCCTVCW